MRTSRTFLLAAALAVTAAGCGDDDDNGNGNGLPPVTPYADDGKLTVMTRNLYLGADLAPVLAANSAEAFLAATTQVWAKVQANNANANGGQGGSPARLVKVAEEIAAAKPDLVGLQEVSLWRTQTPGDAAFGGTTQATAVVYDYLTTIVSELRARGLEYDVARQVELVDLEAPVIVQGGTIDARLTDRDVILVRKGVPVTNARGGVFSAASLGTVPVFGRAEPFAVKRGWGAVDATIAQKQITFANTHLEAFDLPTPGNAGLARPTQAAELVTALAGVTGPLVLVGDVNATADASGDAHDILVTTGSFTDAWDTAGVGPGLTCCFAESLAVADPTLTSRIDVVLLRPGSGTLTPEAMDVVGEAAADRSASGLWPSDHAGVTATIAP